MFVHIATVSPFGGLHLWVSSGHGDGNNRKKKHCNWCCAHRILVLQLGVHANEAKIFKAHVAPLGLCDNLINALKLLADQQKDCHSPMQSIVTALHERNRKGIMEGLRSFIKEDNHRAVDVGRLR